MCSQAFVGVRGTGEIATIEQTVCVLVQCSGIGCRRGVNAGKSAMTVLVAPAAAARTRRVARDRGGAHEAMEESMGEERFSHAVRSRSSRAWVKRSTKCACAARDRERPRVFVDATPFCATFTGS